MYIMTEVGWVNLADYKVCSNHNNLEGVFRPASATVARLETNARALRWEKAMNAYVRGEYGGDRGWTEMWNDMRLSEPIEGAFGERL